MKEKLEPLLKEEVETFPFLQEEKNLKSKAKIKIPLNRETITTIIVTILVLAFVYNSLYPFYIGFKYYDLRFENTTKTTEK